VATEELVSSTSNDAATEDNHADVTQQESVSTSDDGKEKEKEKEDLQEASSSSSEEGYLYEEVTI